MITIEITGQPCSGKSTYIDKILSSNKDYVSNSDTVIQKIYFFFYGFMYLETSRIKEILKWSLKENASLCFRLNIFRNAIAKFGMFKKKYLIKLKKDHNFFLDEGISHLPFLFLETDSKVIVEFIFNELQQVNVVFLKSPGLEVIKKRLQDRGHKRLKFLNISNFVDRNKEIEEILIPLYINSCKNFEII
tara:strand:- start:385 stop:954 length:570 start_codon:yes stop_codon:yes gene_type:complete